MKTGIRHQRISRKSGHRFSDQGYAPLKNCACGCGHIPGGAASEVGGGGVGSGGGGGGVGADCPPSLASSVARRAFSASFSSRASRAMSLTASNSSRLTRSRSRSHFSAWFLNIVSNSRLTPWATPAASFIRRATSSKKRLVVWVMGGLQADFATLPDGGDPRVYAEGR